eukprot:1239675-Amphidinium_carterae.2
MEPGASGSANVTETKRPRFTRNTLVTLEALLEQAREGTRGAQRLAECSWEWWRKTRHKSIQMVSMEITASPSKPVL